MQIEEDVNEEGYKRNEFCSEKHCVIDERVSAVLWNGNEANNDDKCECCEHPIAVVGYERFHFFSFLWVEHGGIVACST